MSSMKKPHKKPPFSQPNFTCKKCDFVCSKKRDFKRHKLTAKHLSGIHGNKKKPIVEFNCENCGKGYKHRSGLSRHKKKCGIILDSDVDDEVQSKNVTMLPSNEDNGKSTKIEISEKDAEINALKIEILKKELKHKDQLIDILKTKGNTTNNNTNNFNNCNNKNLTVNLYLNEHCKDAMNLTDFVNQITVQLEDILFQG